MELWHIWIIAGIILWILEIYTPGFFLASFGSACFGASIVCYMGYGINFQMLVFSILTLIFFFTIRPIFKKYFFRFDEQRPIGVKALVGRTGKVIETIRNDENSGRVKIGGEDWKALSEDEGEIEEGEVVVIKRIEGVTAFVERKSREISSQVGMSNDS